MTESEIPYTERQLIQRAIVAGIDRNRQKGIEIPTWAVAKDVFMCGKTVSTAICWKYGFDPDLSTNPGHTRTPV
jgi:hypothetical protein